MKGEYIVDLVIADSYMFESRDVFSEEENEKLKNELHALPDDRKRLAHLLNTYTKRGLEFISAESGDERSLNSLFMGPGIWVGYLIFRKTTD